MSNTVTLSPFKIETAPDPTVSVIWMHGLGADGRDFIPVIKELDLQSCPPIRFIFPNAPRIPVTINGGYVMPAWYDIRDEDIPKREDETGLRASQKLIDELIDNELIQNPGKQKIILAGFSQGCAMALQAGLRQSTKLAGLLCLSGYLPLYQTVAVERHVANQDVPIFMAHGTVDPVVPFLRAQESRELLITLGYQVEWHEYLMEHTMSLEEIKDIGDWFRRVLR